MSQPKGDGAINPLAIPHSLLTSPDAVKVFLDALAELIAEAILEETAQGTLQDAKNTSPATANAEVPQC